MKKGTVVRRIAGLVAALMPLTLIVVGGPAAAKPPARLPAPALAAAPALTEVPADALTEALEEGHLSQAEYALHRARSVFKLGAVREEFGSVDRIDPHGATLVLRDLALRLNSLEGEEREIAVDILERPTQGSPEDFMEYTVPEATPIETAHFRIHYVTSSDDESTVTYATQISLLMEEVWTKEIDILGWMQPKSDGTRGGGEGKFDVYLGNLYDDMLYGYCSTDPNQTSTSQHSYCVLDNGYTEFAGPVTGMDAARVTAAHEFNHALQFSGDVTDDYWMLEAMATWIEDEVFDDINDNYQYLTSSSLARPRTPADTWTNFSNPSDPDTGFQYGQFIWMRYLSEKAGDPSIVREIWEKATADGFYSIKAIQEVLGTGTEFAESFADFAAVNTKASRFYEEGTAYESVVAPVRTASHAVVPGVPVKSGQTDVDHLTSRYVSFTPGAGVTPDEKLTIAVDLGSAPMQKATVVSLSGTTMTKQPITLTSGEGQAIVPFGSVSEVVLVLTNASNRMTNCSRWSPGRYSCGGTPIDDARAYTYSAVTGEDAVDPGEPQDDGPVAIGPRVQNFKATPSVFSPNGDGRKDKTKILFDLLDDANVSLSIVRNGTVIGYFARNQALAGGYRYPVVWNGRKPSGQLVKNGTYTVKLKAVGATGTTTKKISVTVRR